MIKQVGGRLSFWLLCLFWKNVEKTSAILDWLYVSESLFVWMGGRDEFTPKAKVLRVDHNICGCIAVESDSRIILLLF